tara:strand:- start:1279 stop:1647 length:369 start_codon:yes stop_codon:yes gene_type:complete
MAKHLFLREELDGECLRQFLVIVPTPGEPEFYRQLLSIDAFRQHWKKVLYHHAVNRSRPRHVFFSCWQHDMEMELRMWREHCQKHQLPLPGFLRGEDIITIYGVWSFYEFIGWDHRAKKFIN